MCVAVSDRPRLCARIIDRDTALLYAEAGKGFHGAVGVWAGLIGLVGLGVG